jgi:hypothetical protein
MGGNFIVWTYGTGNPGLGPGELMGPHTAEENPFNSDEIVVAEQYGSDILVVNRSTNTHRVLYGERGVRGGGQLLDVTHSAHYLPSGPYKGHVIITEYRGDSRVMIIHKDTGEVLWQAEGLPELPLDAIYWDDEHIMVSFLYDGIMKVRVSDSSQVWHYPRLHKNSRAFYLQKIDANIPGYSYGGGDLLTSHWRDYSRVQELRTSDGSVSWEYGTGGTRLEKHEFDDLDVLPPTHRHNGENQRPGLYGDFYNVLSTPAQAFRYSMSECEAGLTIVVDEHCRLIALDMLKETVWEWGGTSGVHRGGKGTKYLMNPTYVSATRCGTLLVTDWGYNMLIEINPFLIPERTRKDGYFFKEYETTDTFVDSPIMESRGYKSKNVQIYNQDESAALTWQVLGSHNVEDWQVIQLASDLGAGKADYVEIDSPWNFIKTQVRSAEAGKAALADVFINMLR